MGRETGCIDGVAGENGQRSGKQHAMLFHSFTRVVDGRENPTLAFFPSQRAAGIAADAPPLSRRGINQTTTASEPNLVLDPALSRGTRARPEW